VFRSLSAQELAELVAGRPELTYQAEHLRLVGTSSAYGVFVKGSLAHICWLMTAELNSRIGSRFLPLKPDAIEIGKAFTLPEFRGRGVYAFAIRSVCAVAREQGFGRVFMVTTWRNQASRRGIEKAGLSRCGGILQLHLPVIGTAIPLLFRCLWR
jgi:RimJ/RimL family protein N-acetyltransferase